MARCTARAVGGQGDFDSNIWVSGLNWYGKPHELLNLARDGTIELAISDAILDEFSRILHDKLEWSDDGLNRMRAEVAAFTKRVSSTSNAPSRRVRCDCDWRLQRSRVLTHTCSLEVDHP
jgi:hypothetical protein